MPTRNVMFVYAPWWWGKVRLMAKLDLSLTTNEVSHRENLYCVRTILTWNHG